VTEAKFSDYDRWLASQHLHIKLDGDDRTPEESATRLKGWPPVGAQEVAVSEIPLEGSGPVGIVFGYDSTVDRAFALVNGRPCLAMWNGDNSVTPQVLTKRGWLTPHELRPGDVLIGTEMSFEPVAQVSPEQHPRPALPAGPGRPVEGLLIEPPKFEQLPRSIYAIPLACAWYAFVLALALLVLAR
jgi:hypothetical protein